MASKMGILSVFYEYRVEGVGDPLINGLHLREWEEDFVVDLRNRIWQTSDKKFSSFDGIWGPEDLLLWKEGQCMQFDDELNKFFLGCGRKVMVSVTPVGAGGADTPFMRAIPTTVQAAVQAAKAEVSTLCHFVMALEEVRAMVGTEVERWNDESLSNESDYDVEFRKCVIRAYNMWKDDFSSPASSKQKVLTWLRSPDLSI